jgi:mannose-1-phosphate guanylyltransferase
LLSILERDADASVIVIPSDHHVEEESVLACAAATALARVEAAERIVLLGIHPDAPEAGFGWILPGEPRVGDLRAVSGFVEKPPAATALQLLIAGGLWNSFLLAFRARTLLRRYRDLMPDVAGALEAARSQRALRSAYRTLLPRDFSRDLLEPSVASLELLAVPRCGWSDLGTPERVAECLRTVKSLSRRSCRARSFPAAALDLRVAQRPLTVGC